MDKDRSTLSKDTTSSGKSECDNLLSSRTSPIIDSETSSSHPPFLRRKILHRGSKYKTRRRAVLKSGECNTIKFQMSNKSYRYMQDIFTTLVDSQWRWTLLCFALAFILSWLGFATFWWLIMYNHGDFDEYHLPNWQEKTNWTPCIANIYSFTSVFLFSIETQHTIGYGSRYTTEECPEAVVLMCLQSVVGVMIQALMAGVVFAKMSRPKQRTQTLLFSKNAIVNIRNGELCLMFRVGDMRKSHIIAATIRAQLITTKVTQEGENLYMNQEELTVGTDGYNNNLLFIWPLTIVHKIDSSSPFYYMTQQDMLTSKFEIVVTLEGTIESTGQPTQARSSYLPQEILWGHQFETMIHYSELKQSFEIDYSLFNKTREVRTPYCSARTLHEASNRLNEEDHDTNRSKEFSVALSGHDNRNEAENYNNSLKSDSSLIPQFIMDIPSIDEDSEELIDPPR